jgi:penicillin V acylase-like amidase (Ntn superfamily)
MAQLLLFGDTARKRPNRDLARRSNLLNLDDEVASWVGLAEQREIPGGLVLAESRDSRASIVDLATDKPTLAGTAISTATSIGKPITLPQGAIEDGLTLFYDKPVAAWSDLNRISHLYTI